MRIFLTNAAIILLSALSFPQEGSLDSTYGTNGIVTTLIGGNNSNANSLSLQPDGKTIAAGIVQVGPTDDDFALVRYNIDGTPDNSFGTGGIVTTSIDSGRDQSHSVVLQSDGKIICGGLSNNGLIDNFALIRYNVDGTIDTTFGSSGIVITAIGTNSAVGREVAIQSDGRILLAGYVRVGATDRFALVRYTSDGVLDPTFGTGGKVTTSIGSIEDKAYSMAIQSDGKILLCGHAKIGMTNDFALVRYNTNGTLDPTFGIGGKVTTPIGNNNDWAFSIAIQSDRKILLSGYTYIGLDYDFALARYNIDGSLDPSFGNAGKVTTPIGGSTDLTNSVAVQTDGKIIVGGYAFLSTLSDFVVARYDVDGILDTSFGTGGIVTTPIGTTHDIGTSLVIQNNGRIILGGYSHNGSNYDFALIRYKASSSIPFSTSFTLGDSWNVISVPGIHPNSMLSDTLYRFRDLATSVFSFSGGGYNPTTILTNGIGYWLKHSGDHTYDWNGTIQEGVLFPQLYEVVVDSFSGVSGWNLIGTYDYSVFPSQLTTSPSGLINGPLFSYTPGFGYRVAVLLETGKGYFVNLSGNGKIAYPPRSSNQSDMNEENNLLKEEWAEITIHDALGKQYILYSTDEQKQLNKFLLPPKPPAGLFDVRYTTDRMVEDISTEKTIDISGAEYPIRVSVAGMDIRLKDIITGEILNTELKNGEEIVIDNAALTKLRVLSNGLIPLEYELSQNFPNPFNPTTKIRYTIPTSGLVTLKVYNSIGEEIALLVNQIQKSGKYEIDFSPTRQASGIYFYTIRSGEYTETKKMILLK